MAVVNQGRKKKYPQPCGEDEQKETSNAQAEYRMQDGDEYLPKEGSV
jgi:hypothetical protein